MYGGMVLLKVAVVMGSDSDLPGLQAGVELLQKLGIPHEVRVISAHRTPEVAHGFSASAAENGFGVIICAAGKAAHLAGVMASGTVLPVIGIPMKAGELDGLDALLATVQMPQGMPVATVAINGAYNAALLAAQMIALSDAALMGRIAALRREMTEKVMAKDAAIRAQYQNQQEGM